MSFRMPWIGAGPPPLTRGAPQWQRQRRCQGVSGAAAVDGSPRPPVVGVGRSRRVAGPDRWLG
eukprot:5466421-Pyramimonas_sp.AAC.1